MEQRRQLNERFNDDFHEDMQEEAIERNIYAKAGGSENALQSSTAPKSEDQTIKNRMIKEPVVKSQPVASVKSSERPPPKMSRASSKPSAFRKKTHRSKNEYKNPTAFDPEDIDILISDMELEKILNEQQLEQLKSRKPSNLAQVMVIVKELLENANRSSSNVATGANLDENSLFNLILSNQPLLVHIDEEFTVKMVEPTRYDEDDEIRITEVKEGEDIATSSDIVSEDLSTSSVEASSDTTNHSSEG